MLVKTNTPAPKSAATSGQWGGDGKVPLMTYQQFKESLNVLVSGPMQIQCAEGEDSPVISRDSQHNENAENQITVRLVKIFFGVPQHADDTPAVEIRASYVISGTVTGATPHTNSSAFFDDYSNVFLSPTGTLTEAAAFLSKYWGWPVEYSTMILASRGIVEQ